MLPAGRFVMGLAGEADAPAHEVQLSPYYLDRSEITYAQFKSFVDGTGYTTIPERDG